VIGLTTAELTNIRNSIDDLLPDTGYILSKGTATSNGAGGLSAAWGTAGTVSYRLDSRITQSQGGGKEEVKSASLLPFHTFILTLTHDATITTANMFKDKDGTSYNVTSVDNGKSWNGSVRCIVEKT
jgi:hypothetical protein